MFTRIIISDHWKMLSWLKDFFSDLSHLLYFKFCSICSPIIFFPVLIIDLLNKYGWHNNHSKLIRSNVTILNFNSKLSAKLIITILRVLAIMVNKFDDDFNLRLFLHSKIKDICTKVKIVNVIRFVHKAIEHLCDYCRTNWIVSQYWNSF